MAQFIRRDFPEDSGSNFPYHVARAISPARFITRQPAEEDGIGAAPVFAKAITNAHHIRSQSRCRPGHSILDALLMHKSARLLYH